jgi:hypothetical protein
MLLVSKKQEKAYTPRTNNKRKKHQKSFGRPMLVTHKKITKQSCWEEP